MLILSESEVRRCLPISLAISANCEALSLVREANDSGANVPTRIGLPHSSPGDWSLFKPASIPSPARLGIKIVSTRASNPSRGKPTVPASVVVLDAETGEVDAVLGGTYLTGARTAAGGALSTQFCRPGAIERLVVFGAGLQAELHAEAISTLAEVEEVTIVNRSLPRASRLREIILEKGFCKEARVVSLGDAPAVEETLRAADVVVAATNSSVPLFDGTLVKSGCHVVGVGSYTPEMREVDEALVNRCRVVVDTPEALQVGDLKHLSNSGRSNLVGLLGDVILGRKIIPKGGDGMDCTFFKSVGTAVQDVVTAHEVLKRARKLGLGTEVDMS